MIRTFFTRWWVVNRLHQFLKTKNGLWWVEQMRFEEYVVEIILKSSILKWLFESSEKNNIEIKVRNVIQLCYSSYVEYMKETKDGGVSYISLSAKGQEIYGVDYLIFKVFLGNAWVKVIGTGIIMILVGLYINNIFTKEQNFKYERNSPRLHQRP